MIRPTSSNLRGTQRPAPSIPASASPPIAPAVSEATPPATRRRGLLPSGWHASMPRQIPQNHAPRR